MDKTRLLRNLNKNKLMRSIEPEMLQSLLESNQIKLKHYDKGNIIHIEGEKCQALEVLVSGEIIVQNIAETGNALTITDMKTGEVLGANLLFSTNNYYPMTIIAKKFSEIVSFEKKAILQLCSHNQIFLENFLECVSDRAVILTGKIKILSRKSLRDSILDYLCFLYQEQQTLKLILPISKKELAEKLGVQRSSLSRELQKMKQAGLIDFDRYSVTIKQLESVVRWLR